MIQLGLQADNPGHLIVLCLGSHADDIEIGCGGTILHLSKQFSNCEFHWVVFSGTGVRGDEARHAASLFTCPSQLKGPNLQSFRDGFMPFSGAEVKSVFEDIKASLSPDLILTHHSRDAHQDHRLVSELTWNTFRDHLILEYEIPKYDGDMGRPNVFVPLSKEECERKVQYLVEAFASQRTKRWFEPETFLSLMRLRGMECNSPSGYAEAFYSRKIIL